MASGGGGDAGVEQQVVLVELPAPSGWRKTVTPKNSGTSKKNEITFIAPTGEKIVNRKQLGQYLKSHPSELTLHEFEWSATGEAPRRSARLREKVKAVAPPMPEPKKKGARRSSSETKENDEETEVTPEEVHDNKDAGAVEESVEVKIASEVVSGKGEDEKVADTVENVGAVNDSVNNMEVLPHEETEVIYDEEMLAGSVEDNKCNEEIPNSISYDADDEKSNVTGTQDSAVKSQNQMITAYNGNIVKDDWPVKETVEHKDDKLNSADDISTERPDAVGSETIKQEENEQKAFPASTNSVGENHFPASTNSVGENHKQTFEKVGQQVEKHPVKETRGDSTAGRDLDPKQQNFMEPVRIDGQKHFPPTLSC